MVSVRKSLESDWVMVPSKSVKKMNLGFVFKAGRVEEDILQLCQRTVGNQLAQRYQSLSERISKVVGAFHPFV